MIWLREPFITSCLNYSRIKLKKKKKKRTEESRKKKIKAKGVYNRHRRGQHMKHCTQSLLRTTELFFDSFSCQCLINKYLFGVTRHVTPDRVSAEKYPFRPDGNVVKLEIARQKDADYLSNTLHSFHFSNRSGEMRFCRIYHQSDT